eukprot:GHVP01027404.1.p1 GENE.GHVP01027404.1~~GHVP01027404.1.p1  ORF type:complete len:742 (+),score=150.43 GHVP01027404.1:1573-3798(+)
MSAIEIETGPRGSRPMIPPNDYEKESQRCSEFITEYYEIEGESNVKKMKYLSQLQEIANGKTEEFRIFIDDIRTHFGCSDSLYNAILNNTNRYESIFYQVVDFLMPQPTEKLKLSNMDVISVIVAHRKACLENSGYDEEKIKKVFPPDLQRRYTILFIPSRSQPRLAIRDVVASHIGKLVRIRCIAIKTSEIMPQLSIGTYTCSRCGYETYQEINSASFMPVPECVSEECKKVGKETGTLELQTRGSKFLRSQEIRIQEQQDQVPVGHMPRSMSVQILESLTRKIKPGDYIDVSGIFLPRPYTGFQAMKAGLLTDTYLRATDIVHLKETYIESSSSSVNLEAVMELSKDPDVYTRLASSIAPEIFGHSDIKKILLLMMTSGVTKTLPDHVRMRGDINVCLMGDPGVAKSQLLKYIAKTVPRGVYTTGKGSSGVGLTAAVTRDQTTNEVMLEGGALVLADNGICCIDEFDKMNDADRTSIHEVMEQQTVSISKAGINAVLNARASILAAANPINSRYNPKKTPNENINLPPALLSRFDIMFLIIDKPDLENDTRLARHVASVHKEGFAPQNSESSITTEVLRRYIGEARKYRPCVSPEIGTYISSAYVALRKAGEDKKNAGYTTARTLLSIVRLSQALCRLRFSEDVTREDVDEALRLFEAARVSVDGVDGKITRKNEGSLVSKAFRMIKSIMEDDPRAEINDIMRSLIDNGLSREVVEECLKEYEDCGIWKIEDGWLEIIG